MFVVRKMPYRAFWLYLKIFKVIYLSSNLGANEEAQDKADSTFSKFETSILADINDFSGVVNVNSKSVTEAQTDLDAIEYKHKFIEVLKSNKLQTT